MGMAECGCTQGGTSQAALRGTARVREAGLAALEEGDAGSCLGDPPPHSSARPAGKSHPQFYFLVAIPPAQRQAAGWRPHTTLQGPQHTEQQGVRRGPARGRQRPRWSGNTRFQGRQMQRQQPVCLKKL